MFKLLKIPTLHLSLIIIQPWLLIIRNFIAQYNKKIAVERKMILTVTSDFYENFMRY